MFRLLKLFMLGMLLSSTVWADDDDWDEGGSYAHPYYEEEIIYVPPSVRYAAPPVVEYIAPTVVKYVPTQPHYYPAPQPVDYYDDRRSPQGLVGGVVGSAIGYELGAGDPLAAGLGAAAGAWFGNGGY